MAAEYDNLLKYLAENHAVSLASWLLGRPVGERVRLLKTELSLQPIRADWMALSVPIVANASPCGRW